MRRTRRQREMLIAKAKFLAANGFTAKDIAVELSIPLRTASRYASLLRTDRPNPLSPEEIHQREQLNRYFGLPRIARMHVSAMHAHYRHLYERVVRELTPTQRRTFVAFYISGIGADRIAVVEGVTPVAIRRRLSRIAGKFATFGLPAPSRFVIGHERAREIQLSQLIEGVHF